MRVVDACACTHASVTPPLWSGTDKRPLSFQPFTPLHTHAHASLLPPFCMSHLSLSLQTTSALLSSLLMCGWLLRMPPFLHTHPFTPPHPPYAYAPYTYGHPPPLSLSLCISLYPLSIGFLYEAQARGCCGARHASGFGRGVLARALQPAVLHTRQQG